MTHLTNNNWGLGMMAFSFDGRVFQNTTMAHSSPTIYMPMHVISFTVVPKFISPTVDALVCVTFLATSVRVHVVDPVARRVVKTITLLTGPTVGSTAVLGGIAVDASNSLFLVVCRPQATPGLAYFTLSRVDLNTSAVVNSPSQPTNLKSIANPVAYYTLLLGTNAVAVTDVVGGIHIFV